MVGEQLCGGGCGSKAKYRCITCKIYVCNRPLCGVAEEDENAKGWMENSSVSYCNDCFFRTPGLAKEPERPPIVADGLREDSEDEEDEEDNY
jgi:hypothetical protein